MSLLQTSRTMSTGITPGTTPTASLARTGLGEKLRLNLGEQTILIGLGSDPRGSLTALRDDLARIIEEAGDAA